MKGVMTSMAWVVPIGGLVLLGSFGFVRGINRRLTSTVNSLNEGADQLNSTAGEVSAASQSLAEGVSEQAASLEETSNSLEEIASMTKRNAENAISAKDLTTQTRQAADSAASDRDQMSKAKEAIKDASGNIAEIIKTTDEIAFQTNILALSAAVSQMDKVTQNNAAGAEQSASASEELRGQAGSLKEVVGELQALVTGVAEASSSGQCHFAPPARALLRGSRNACPYFGGQAWTTDPRQITRTMSAASLDSRKRHWPQPINGTRSRLGARLQLKVFPGKPSLIRNQTDERRLAGPQSEKNLHILSRKFVIKF